MAPSLASLGYDLGLGALVAMFIVFYAPMIYVFIAMSRQQKDKLLSEDSIRHE